MHGLSGFKVERSSFCINVVLKKPHNFCKNDLRNVLACNEVYQSSKALKRFQTNL